MSTDPAQRAIALLDKLSDKYAKDNPSLAEDLALFRVELVLLQKQADAHAIARKLFQLATWVKFLYDRMLD